MGEKEKPEVHLSTEGCINALRNLQDRTKGYVHLFPEMSRESCDTWAAIDKEALERAIQALRGDCTTPRYSVEDALTWLRWRVELSDKAVGRERELIEQIIKAARDIRGLCSLLRGEVEKNGATIDNQRMAESEGFLEHIRDIELEMLSAIEERLALMER